MKQYAVRHNVHSALYIAGLATTKMILYLLAGVIFALLYDVSILYNDEINPNFMVSNNARESITQYSCNSNTLLLNTFMLHIRNIN